MKIYYFLVAIIIALIVLFFQSCAPIGETSREYGFFSGILHGIVFIPAFAINLIIQIVGGNTTFSTYAVNNSGFFYWFGYITGVVISLLIFGTGGIIGLIMKNSENK